MNSYIHELAADGQRRADEENARRDAAYAKLAEAHHLVPNSRYATLPELRRHNELLLEAVALLHGFPWPPPAGNESHLPTLASLRGLFKQAFLAKLPDPDALDREGETP